MSYARSLSNIIGNSRTYEEQIQIEQLFKIIEMMIKEITPQIIEKYMREHKESIDIDIKTYLNGELTDMNEIKNKVLSRIIKELSS